MRAGAGVPEDQAGRVPVADRRRRSRRFPPIAPRGLYPGSRTSSCRASASPGRSSADGKTALRGGFGSIPRSRSGQPDLLAGQPAAVLQLGRRMRAAIWRNPSGGNGFGARRAGRHQRHRPESEGARGLQLQPRRSERIPRHGPVRATWLIPASGQRITCCASPISTSPPSTQLIANNADAQRHRVR